MKRAFLVSMLLAAVLALAPQRASANEITVTGTTSSSAPPSGITFTNGSFGGSTSGGFAGFSNLGSFTLSSNPGTYNATLTFTVVFTLPTGISGGGTTSFVDSVFGSVVNNSTGGVDIVFSNPSQTFSFSNASGTGSFTFNLNNVSLNPGGTTAVSGFVTGGSITPVSTPEPSTALFLGVGLLLTPFLKRRILG